MTLFDGLDGIRNHRSVRPRIKTAVDKLLKERDTIAQSSLDLQEDLDLEAARAQLTAQTAQLEFSPADLTTLVLATANSEYDEETWKRVGLYTGVLLTVLTQRTPSSFVQLNLGDSYFPYLFYAAQHVGRLAVTHAHGEGMLSQIAWKGRAEYVCATHLQGHRVLSRPAWRGEIRQLVAIHLQGLGILSWAPWEGEIGQLVASHITGDHTLHWTAYYGKIGQLIATYLQGNPTLLLAATGGTIRQLTTYRLLGHHPLYEHGKGILQHLHDNEAEAWLRQHKLDILLDPHATFDSDTIETLTQQLSQLSAEVPL